MITTLLLSSLVTLGLLANPQAGMAKKDRAEQLLVQKTEKKPPKRPAGPNLGNVKKLSRPGLAPARRGGFKPGPRMNPAKPNLRSRGGRAGQQVKGPRSWRPQDRDRKPSGRKPQDRRKGSKATRKLKGPSSPVDAEATPKKDGSAALKDKDKRCRPLPAHVKVRMNFNEAEVLEIVQWISEQTCKNFIIGDGIRGGKITILSNTPVSPGEAYRAFLSALNVNNMTVVKVGRFYKVQMKREAAKDTIPTYIGEEVDIPELDMMVTRLLQLKYIDANTVNATVKQLTTKDGDSYPYAPTNSLIISDTGSNMHRIMRILDQLDTPLGQEEIRVLQVNFAMATELATTLEEIFGTKGKGKSKAGKSHRIKPVRGKKGIKKAPPAGGGGPDEDGVSVSKIISDERTNQLIVMATARSFPRIQELIDKLDVPIPGEGQIQVIYLKHADAEELAQTLTSLAQGTSSGIRKGGSGKRSSSRKSGPTKAAELFQGEVKVTADIATNSLVIVASQSDFKSMHKVIKKLDILRRQVFVEAVIMEVNMDTSRDVGLAFHGGTAAEISGETVPLFFGTQFKTQGSNINSLVPNISLLGFMSGLQGPELNASDSILGSIAMPSFGVALHALQTDSNVNVLSTPHILTSDNEEAEIMVGENIPIPAGYGGGGGMNSMSGLASMASRSGISGASSMLGGMGGLGGMMGMMGMGGINRQEVGLTLKLKPQINEGDYIRIELEEELSEVKDSSNPLGPTTTKRSAKTVVVVKDQQTVVIGGLMREKLDVGETKIPILGDIPVLGWLFRTKRTQKTKTNLLLFLTPYVIESQADFRTIFERKIRERKEFMERFYEAGSDYQAFIDFRRKRGPLGDIHKVLSEEMRKVENGGSGNAELLITPDGSGKIETKNDEAGTLKPEAKTPTADSADDAPDDGASDSAESKDNHLEVE
ncbi:MAG: type II secretion system secretin GspD [Deltaproteobacteria bacterium]|nr:type II secretion system secretin GspD [Deltaproteobacteria bacterium]